MSKITSFISKISPMSCQTPTPTFVTVTEPVTSNLVNLTSSLSLSSSCKRTLASKIKNLIEISHIPDRALVEESLLPLLNPYNIYRRFGSFTRSISSINSSRRSLPKEYVQTSRMDQYSLKSTTAKQHVTLEFPPTLILIWRRQGYSHLHFGAIRIILTLHGKRG